MLARLKQAFARQRPSVHEMPSRMFHEKCVEASMALASRGYDAESAKLLAFFPKVKLNPFQHMLYSAGYENGFACFDAKTPEEMSEGPNSLNMVAHYHWVSRVFEKSGNARAASLATQNFLDLLKSQQDAGHTLVWTVHNILSHGSKFPDEEAELRARMADLMDHIHIMNPDTVALCQPYFSIRAEKVFHVPHPSYHGVYGDYIGQAEARHTLGLLPDEKAFLLFGNMMQQKGGVRFLSELDVLQEKLDGKARVFVVGKSFDKSYLAKVQALVADRSDVQLHLGYLDDQKVQVYFRAVDVVVCPYAITLNSGVVMTAASFGRPVVVPHSLKPILADVERQSVSYNIDDMSDCIDACVKAVEIGEIADTEMVLGNWAQTLAPRRVSHQFFEALRNRL